MLNTLLWIRSIACLAFASKIITRGRDLLTATAVGHHTRLVIQDETAVLV